jgi:hypothetical protein
VVIAGPPVNISITECDEREQKIYLVGVRTYDQAMKQGEVTKLSLIIIGALLVNVLSVMHFIIKESLHQTLHSK